MNDYSNLWIVSRNQLLLLHLNLACILAQLIYSSEMFWKQAQGHITAVNNKFNVDSVLIIQAIFSPMVYVVVLSADILIRRMSFTYECSEELEWILLVVPERSANENTIS